MTPTPEWFFTLLTTQVVPVVLVFAIAGALLGLIAAVIERAARDVVSKIKR